jgi:hypothetical protein
MQSNFVDSIAEGRCRPTAARNEDSHFGSWSVRGVLSSRTMPIVMDGYSIKRVFDTLEHVHQRSVALQRTPRHRYAIRRRTPQPRRIHRELRQIADGRNDILAEAAGITAGSCTPGRPPTSAMN